MQEYTREYKVVIGIQDNTIVYREFHDLQGNARKYKQIQGCMKKCKKIQANMRVRIQEQYKSNAGGIQGNTVRIQ